MNDQSTKHGQNIEHSGPDESRVQRLVDKIEGLIQESASADPQLAQQWREVEEEADPKIKNAKRIALARQVQASAELLQNEVERQRKRFEEADQTIQAGSQVPVDVELEREAARQALADRLRSQAGIVAEQTKAENKNATQKEQRRSRRWMKV